MKSCYYLFFFFFFGCAGIFGTSYPLSLKVNKSFTKIYGQKSSLDLFTFPLQYLPSIKGKKDFFILCSIDSFAYGVSYKNKIYATIKSDSKDSLNFLIRKTGGKYFVVDSFLFKNNICIYKTLLDGRGRANIEEIPCSALRVEVFVYTITDSFIVKKQLQSINTNTKTPYSCDNFGLVNLLNIITENDGFMGKINYGQETKLYLNKGQLIDKIIDNNFNRNF